MARRISQREARAALKRVAELERILRLQRSAWAQEWIGGTEICRVTWPQNDDMVPQSVRTARRLNHAVVVVGDDSGMVRFIALPHADEAVR